MTQFVQQGHTYYCKATPANSAIPYELSIQTHEFIGEYLFKPPYPVTLCERQYMIQAVVVFYFTNVTVFVSETYMLSIEMPF